MLRRWSARAAIGVAVLSLLVQLKAGSQAGPLSQYADNIHQMHIVARYRTFVGGTPIMAVVVQTVTAVAVKSTEEATYWVVERDHTDPELFYRERNVPRGTPIQFEFFVGVIRNFPAALITPGHGDPIQVAKLTDHYALLRENRARTIAELPIAADVREGESVIVAVLQGGGPMQLGTFTETTTQITQASPEAALFFIYWPHADVEATHGAPVFVQREGSWLLAGIRVAHNRSLRPDWSAVARLPKLEELIPPKLQSYVDSY